ncbi:MAG: lactate utilization protein [Terriglobales bacterium]|jgi:L-lactate dehydrogenase complex protein LldG
MTTGFEEFKMRAEAVGAHVQRVETKQDALRLIVDLLLYEESSDDPHPYAVWAKCSTIDSADQRELSARAPGIEFHVTRDNAAQAKVGISQMDWALADTGTLVQVADAVDKRLVSTLPPLHIALVPTASILPNLPSLLSKIAPKKAGYLAFITGPSRTADIERVLTIGVHGPARLVIVMVDDMLVTQ